MSSEGRVRVGIVGARGYVGGELIRLLAAHPDFELAYVSSRELEGQRVADHIDAPVGELRYSAPDHAELPSLGAEAVVLALPRVAPAPDIRVTTTGEAGVARPWTRLVSTKI